MQGPKGLPVDLSADLAHWTLFKKALLMSDILDSPSNHFKSCRMSAILLAVYMVTTPFVVNLWSNAPDWQLRDPIFLPYVY